MNVIILGAAGFIGTNLVFELVKEKNDYITLVDQNRDYFPTINLFRTPIIKIVESKFEYDTDWDSLLKDQDIVYHLISSTAPSTANQKIAQEMTINVGMTANLLDACVRQKVKKVIFLSSGGTVYGKAESYPLKETTSTDPISSYGIQKLTIEKLLYLYHYMYNLDYRIIRLANPYGPYQRPNGALGAVTTFTYKALRGEQIIVYGNGSVVRDYIYIADAIKAILKIVNGESEYRIFNLGCGYGTSIGELLDIIKKTLNIDLDIKYMPGRPVDVPVNYLDISRFIKAYGKLNPIPLDDGIMRTANFMKQHYKL
ncbi:MAG: NAD-dependent epimerase/dehydratase family protein [Lachnospiraceae bacterium]|nr:NAD-dependent epimerase/dehydratase family protein [Lachnospiraceae bacterium]